MTDALNGWLTCEPTGGVPRPALYKTIDGGTSWVAMGLMTDGAKYGFTDICQTSSALIITSRNLASTGYVSYDSGKTFTPVLPITNGIDFVDKLHGVVTGFREQIWSHT